jgi:hypothetical protein
MGLPQHVIARRCSGIPFPFPSHFPRGASCIQAAIVHPYLLAGAALLAAMTSLAAHAAQASQQA